LSDKNLTPQGSPNLNRGGNGPGNPYGSGAKKKEFRVKASEVALKGLKYWERVALGQKCIVVPGQKGAAATRYPTHTERQEAFVQVFLKYGIGTEKDVTVHTIEDGELLEKIAAVTAQFVSPESFPAWWESVKAALEGEEDPST
jgi:hypothetical protein